MTNVKMPIYFSTLTYNIRYYGNKKGKLILRDKLITKSSREVHIGNTIELLNDRKYNNRLIETLKLENKKTQGCEINIVGVETIAQCGFTNSRFNEE